MFLLSFVLWFCSLQTTTTETPTCVLPKPTQGNPIYGSWKLVSFTFTGVPETGQFVNTPEEIETLQLSMLNGEVFKIYFDDAGGFGYNLDANSCGTRFELLPDNQIFIGERYSGSICTQLCCDKVHLHYRGEHRYEINDNALALIGSDWTYRFVRSN